MIGIVLTFEFRHDNITTWIMTIFDKVVNYIEIEPALACVHVLPENILSFTKLM